MLNTRVGLLSRARGKGIPQGGVTDEEVRQMPLNSISLPGGSLSKVRKSHVHAGVTLSAADRKEGRTMAEALVEANMQSPSGENFAETFGKQPLLLLEG